MVKDMNGMRIEVGDTVLRYSLIMKKSESPQTKEVLAIQPMHKGGEKMVWFKSGGSAHHPLACEVLESEATNDEA